MQIKVNIKISSIIRSMYTKFHYLCFRISIMHFTSNFSYMKFHSFIALLVLAALLTACGHKIPRTVENPSTEANNTRSLDVTRVELTDSATIIDISVEYRPHYWIKIAPTTTLAADGKSYALVSAEGIEPGKELWMPDSGKTQFKLIFEPLPASTESFDFIEEPGGWQIWGIDAVGDRTGDTFTDALPAHLKKVPDSDSLPMPVLKVDTAIVNIQMIGYRDGMPANMALYVEPLEGGHEEYTVKAGADGTASISIPLAGPARAFVVESDLGFGYNDIWIAPGEETNVYIHPFNVSPKNRQNFSSDKRNNILTDGSYSVMNFYRGQYSREFTNDLLAEGRFSLSDTPDLFTDKLLAFYKEWSDSITSYDIPAQAKEMAMLNMQAEVMNAASNPARLIASNYYNSNPMAGRISRVSIATTALEPEQLATIGALFDTGNPRLLLFGIDNNNIDWRQYGASTPLTSAISAYSEACGKASQLALTEADLKRLAEYGDFFAEAASARQERTRSLREKYADSGLLTPTPDATPDKLLSAITAPHKGKVVLVDLWNTWCGPCRHALAHNEPLKSTELSSDDIVWIYIADESSPEAKYMSMLPDIKGIHYRLTEDQINAIRDQFKVDGIPYYIMVDRNGNASGRPDFRDHNLMKKTLLEAVASK